LIFHAFSPCSRQSTLPPEWHGAPSSVFSLRTLCQKLAHANLLHYTKALQRLQAKKYPIWSAVYKYSEISPNTLKNFYGKLIKKFSRQKAVKPFTGRF